MSSSRLSVVGMVFEGEPYDAQTWSGCSPFFFDALREEGVLRAAIGAGVTRLQAALLRIAAIHPDVQRWKFREGVNVWRRRLRTCEGLRKLASVEDESYDTILQIGAFYDFTGIPGKRTASYNDANLQALVRGFPERADRRSHFVRAALEYENRVHSRTDLIFTMSRWAADSFVRDLHISASRVEAVGAGTNLHQPPELRGKDYGSANVLFVGRDFERKGGYTLLDAFRRVRRAVPGATLTIVGPRVLGGLPPGVRSLGFLSKRTEQGRRTIEDAYREAAVFVLPSIWEPFGISILEAQSRGLACVGSRVCAMPELIEETGAGIVVAPRDSGALAEALIALLRDPLACAQMGRAGRDRQQSYYTWQRVASRVKERLTLMTTTS